MLNNSKYFGICTTCNNAPFCAQANNSKHPVWLCDMFDNSVVSKKKEKEEKVKSDFAHKYSSKYKGLCMNCENRETCKFATCEDGIWHCTEYQ